MACSMLVIAGFMSMCSARRVQSLGQEDGARNWELENLILHRAGVINDAELGMANLKHAVRDPSLLAEVARGLRHPEGRAELIKMLANPNFQKQMEVLREAKDVWAESLTPDLISVRADPFAGLLLALGRAPSVRTDIRMDGSKDLEALGMAQNPTIGYFDPLKLADSNLWSMGDDATVGWLRHAEIKHGRVAMAGFVGYCIHENGIRWPFALSLSLPDYSSFEGLSAPAVWDAIPSEGKLQIITIVGLFEIFSEKEMSEGQGHYMKGGKPGYFPGWGSKWNVVPNLFDPAGFTKKLTEEQKARKLNIEINNGRLAMLGLMSLISEAKVPGAVPLLAGRIKEYDGQVMAPFSENDVGLALVKEMIDFGNKQNLYFTQ